MVYPAEAIYVFHIFERFAAGDILGKISTPLARMNVHLPERISEARKQFLKFSIMRSILAMLFWVRHIFDNDSIV